MTANALLDLKQRISRLKESERREVAAYLMHLQHEKPAWRREISRSMKEMDAGKKVTLSELKSRLGHG